jgi:hypothetical protein
MIPLEPPYSLHTVLLKVTWRCYAAEERAPAPTGLARAPPPAGDAADGDATGASARDTSYGADMLQAARESAGFGAGAKERRCFRGFT